MLMIFTRVLERTDRPIFFGSPMLIYQIASCLFSLAWSSIRIQAYDVFSDVFRSSGDCFLMCLEAVVSENQRALGRQCT